MLILVGLGVLGVIGALSIYFTLLFVAQCWFFRDFRGPMALPLVGNLHDTRAFNFISYISKQRKRFGKVFLFFGFWQPRLIICDPVIIRRVLSDPKRFPKGADYTSRFACIFGAGLVTSVGEKHRKDRAIFGKYFIRSNVMRITPIINEIAAQAVDELLRSCSSLPHGRGKQLNAEHFFAVLALRAFMMFSISTDFRNNPERENVLCAAVSKASGAAGRSILYGIPSWAKFHPDIQAMESSKDEVMKDFNAIAETRQKLLDSNEEVPDDCLTAMLREKLSYEEKRDHFVTLICAGHDTTAYFNAYCIYLLAQHPECQEKLREEVNQQLQGRDEITADDITEMNYLNQLMQETLRFYAIIPNVARSCVEETHIKEANITIPKGADLLIPMSIINRDPTIYDSPAEFRPERFGGKGTDYTSAKNGFFPFGFGSRTCIGNTLAQIESGIFISKLVQRCRFESDPSFKLRIQSGISLTTYGGIDIIVKPL